MGSAGDVAGGADGAQPGGKMVAVAAVHGTCGLGWRAGRSATASLFGLAGPFAARQGFCRFSLVNASLGLGQLPGAAISQLSYFRRDLCTTRTILDCILLHGGGRNSARARRCPSGTKAPRLAPRGNHSDLPA